MTPSPEKPKTLKEYTFIFVDSRTINVYATSKKEAFEIITKYCNFKNIENVELSKTKTKSELINRYLEKYGSAENVVNEQIKVIDEMINKSKR